MNAVASVFCRAADPIEIAALEASIPEFSSPKRVEEIAGRLAGVPSLSLLAEDECGRTLAYKVAYALDDTTLYSWIGAVKPEARRRGVATMLRQMQEDWARLTGFERIRVKSSNRYPQMLQLLIEAGYLLVDLQRGEDPLNHQLVLEKNLHRD